MAKQVKEHVKVLLADVEHLKAALQHPGETDPDALADGISTYLERISQLHALAASVDDVPLPIAAPHQPPSVSLLKAVDCGKYPDHHTKDLFEAAVASNQVSKGKAQAFRLLHSKVAAAAAEMHSESAGAFIAQPSAVKSEQ